MYQHPGVYTRQITSRTLTIEAAPTSVTAFIGHVRRGTPVTASGGKPTYITSLAQYATLFGPGSGAAGGVKNLHRTGDVDLFGLAVRAYFANGGSRAYIVPVDGSGGTAAGVSLPVSGNDAARAISVTANSPGSWANDLMVELTSDRSAKTFDLAIGTAKPARKGATRVMDQVIERFTGLVWQGRGADVQARLADAHAKAAKSINAGSALIKIAFGPQVTMPASDAGVSAVMRGGQDTDAPALADYDAALARLEAHRDIATLVLPDVTPDATGRPIYKAAIDHAEKMHNRMVIVDPGADNIRSSVDAREAAFTNSPCAALYYPRVEVSNPYSNTRTASGIPRSHFVGPAAVVAGLWARTDGTRGVWKSPAGMDTVLRGVLGPERKVSNAAQDNLNEWGVNCLRSFNGPTLVWGARTAATKATPEYRYIAVRRTQNMINESLHTALRSVVFQPNTEDLWAELRGASSTFLHGLFRSGAFAGEKFSDAYFVKCGLGATMTQADVDAGILRLTVGFAPLKPAEFVILQISQKLGQTA